MQHGPREIHITTQEGLAGAHHGGVARPHLRYSPVFACTVILTVARVLSAKVTTRRLAPTGVIALILGWSSRRGVAVQAASASRMSAWTWAGVISAPRPPAAPLILQRWWHPACAGRPPGHPSGERATWWGRPRVSRTRPGNSASRAPSRGPFRT